MYETELMREILKSPMAQKMIQQISPRYGKAYTFLWLMQVMGAEWDEMAEWVESYPLQVVPQTATWSLDWWEMQYNITPDHTATDEQRRRNIVNKMTSHGPMNPYKLEQIATTAAGYKATIEENTGKNRFALHLEGAPYKIDEEAVKAAIKPVKPPRLIYDIDYTETEAATPIYYGTAIQCAKKVTLQQL